MSVTWIRTAPGHYATDDGAWHIRRDEDRFLCYVIFCGAREQGSARTLKSAMVKAGKMFATIEEARAAAIGPFWTKQEWDAMTEKPFRVAA